MLVLGEISYWSAASRCPDPRTQKYEREAGRASSTLESGIAAGGVKQMRVGDGMSEAKQTGARQLKAVKSTKSGRGRKRSKMVGLKIPRYFTRKGEDPFDGVEWELRSAKIMNEHGEVVFEQKDVEIPASWSQLATNVVVSKYIPLKTVTTRNANVIYEKIGHLQRVCKIKKKIIETDDTEEEY